MAAAVPFIPQIIGGASAGISALLGKKKAGQKVAPYTPNAAYTQPLAQFGGGLLPMAQAGYQKAFDYHTNMLANPELATASDAASIGRQTQQLTDRAARTMPRGGAQAALLAQLPQQQMAAGLERRIGAQQQSANSLGALAGQAGGLGTNVFGGLLGNELGGYGASSQAGIGQGYLNLAQAREDRDYYGRIGGSIYDILTGSPGNNKGSIMDVILGKLGGGGTTKVPGAPGSFNVPIGSLPKLPGSIYTPPTF